MKTIGYTVVMAQKPKPLSKRVKELLVQGWEPQGGVAVHGGVRWMYQAMAKRQPEAEDKPA